ncbi:MAG: type IV-A pilus assembly ATPase PilB [Bdellovibrionota bacterium]
MLATRLADVLISEKVVNAEQLAKLLDESRKRNVRFVDALVAEKIIDEGALLKILAKNYRLTIMDLSGVDLDQELVALVSAALCKKHKILPVGKRGGTLVIATCDPTNVQCLDEIRFQTRLRVEQVLCSPSVLNEIIEREWGSDNMSAMAAGLASDAENASVIDSEKENGGQSEHSENDAPIIQYVSSILTDAVRKRASDIHIEPYETELRIRFRIDGDLVPAAKPPVAAKTALVARIKVMSKMRIDEKRLPQDGRIRFKTPEGKIVDFRVNTLPTIYGEKVVLRILDKSSAVVDMESLGFEKDDLQKFITAVTKPWGICLVTGATGSGKTTTLYGAINFLNKPDVNISTIEDPVEYNFKGINQTQTKEHIGLTFSETLRALLRQDPDIILLGEVRDKETAEIAFKAALTGHMVLSTLHTNDAASTIMRLKDMGLDSFLINAAVHVIVAQRLVRRICKECKVEDTSHSSDELKKMGFSDSIIGKFKPMIGKGCPACRGTGYKGRVAIHEVMVLTETLKEKIGQNMGTNDLRKAAIAEGMRTLKVNCMRKVIAGVTTVGELQAAD